MDNNAIANQFSLLSKLMDIHGENSFKSKSYAAAAFNIDKLPTQLKELPKEKIASLKGVGDSSAKKIIELLETGELKVLMDIIQQTPAGIIDMLSIKGIGPKKINTIWKELEIETIGELLYACEENRLLLYKGFGEKTQNNIRDSIEFYLQNQGSFLYAQVESFAKTLTDKLHTLYPKNKTELTGAFRRQIEIIEELAICTTISANQLKLFFDENSYQIITETESQLNFIGPEKIKLNFYLTNTDLFFKKLFETSCSESFLTAWKNKFPWNENSAFQTEEHIFENAGIHIIPSYLREDEKMIQLSADDSLPNVIRKEDIKAIIHSHSNWSDGSNTIEEMANHAIHSGLEYLVISDHSKSAFYANGLSEERILQQHKYVDELNDKLKPFKIFKSIESDILHDGSLDYPDHILSTFDLVIASVHSNLKMPEEKAMMRLQNAIANPFTTILGHMTGRLLLSRNGYPIDHKKIIDLCAEKKVVIELNAHPRRLDMDWRHIAYALEKNVIISIDPDAHALSGFEDVKYGVLVAQKAGLTKNQNLSSFSLEEFEAYLLNIKSIKNI